MGLADLIILFWARRQMSRFSGRAATVRIDVSGPFCLFIPFFWCFCCRCCPGPLAKTIPERSSRCYL